MNKKGFTLIELLAVIIILAIIALIAVPTVIGIIDSSKEKASEQSVNMILHAAELYYAEKTLTDETINSSNNIYASLEIKGEKPENGKVYLNDDGQVKLDIIINNKKYTKDFDDKDFTIIDLSNASVPSITDVTSSCSGGGIGTIYFTATDSNEIDSITCEYGLSNSYGSVGQVTNNGYCNIQIEGPAGTKYYYKLTATNSLGLSTTYEGILTVTTYISGGAA